ncbi:PAS domain S-box protein [Oligoflexus tunisiensis]|uniref:PAS domain S-box protein n=1 Tax=Oligoflexus tunisiensis TaxID=708132 RepID=UPI00159F2E50|nr:PAS domain S-box protein [Oligoflexus tunisiensis]
MADRPPILLVDDHDKNLITLAAVLDNPAYNLVLATSGQEALERLSEQEFAVILSDIKMPAMDGFQFARRARQIPSSKETPIIFLTGADDDQDQLLKAYSAGAVDYLQKPFEPVIVRAKVDVFVRLFEQRHYIAEQTRQLYEAERELQAAQQEARERELCEKELRLHHEAEEKAARTIRQNEERLRLAFQAGGMGSWSYDIAQDVSTWSPEMEEILGLLPGSFSGRREDLLAMIHPEDRDRMQARFDASVAHEGRLENDYRVVRPDGTIRWVISRGYIHRNSDGLPVRIIGVVIDVSRQKESENALRTLNDQLQTEIIERKRAEQALIASEAQLSLITNSLPALVAYIDENHRYQFANAPFGKLLGIHQEEFRGKSIAEILGSSAYENIKPHLEKSFQGETVNFEAPMTYNDSTQRWINATYVPDFDQNGAVRGIVALVHDTTERRRAEDELRMQAQVLDSMIEGVSLADDQGYIVYTNPAEDRIFGYERGELLGKHVTVQNSYSDSENKEIVDRMISHLKTRGAWAGEFLNKKKDGTRFVTYARINSIEMSGRTWFVCVQEDITERKRAEEALRESEARARRYGNTQKFLVEAAAVLSSSLDYEHTLRHVASLVVPGMADWCAVSIADEDGTVRQLATAHIDPRKVELAREIQKRYPPDPALKHGTLHVIRTGEAEIMSDIPDSLLESGAKDPEHLAIIKNLGMKSYMCLPLKVAGRILGAISFVSAESGRRYDSRDLLLAEQLAQRAAIAVENSRLYGKAKDAIKKQKEALALLDSLISTAPVGFAFLDRQLRYGKINDYLASLHGTVPERALGKTIWEVNPGVAPGLSIHYKKVLESGEVIRNLNVKGESPLSPGEIRHWNVTYYPVYIEGGATSPVPREPIGVGVISSDITEIVRAEESLRDEKRIVERLNQIGRTLVVELDLEKLVQAATDVATELSGAEFGAFFYNVHDGQHDSYMLYTISGVTRDKFSKFPMPRKTAIFSPTFEGTRIIRLDDVTKDPRYGKNTPYHGMPEGHLPVRSYLAVPVISRHGDVMGALFFGHSKAGMFSERSEDAVIGIAAQAAIAIDNANLFKRAQDELAAKHKAEEEVRLLNENLERLVHERTAELKSANKELESFSYSVSHDLRSPLRGIDGFSQLLLERYADQMDERGRGYLLKVRAASQRMGQLIDDILNLSRVTRREMKRENVNLAELAKRIVAELSSGDPSRTVNLILPEKLWAYGDAGLLSIALENLIGNAWKFTSKHERATIELGTHHGNHGDTEYYIRDDGAGFDMAFSEKLFGAFQRLHDNDEFPGTGIGLATVQRIVHRHGGRLWADAAVEQGATFHFTLPAPTCEGQP